MRDLPDGSRLGQLFDAGGHPLDEARCEDESRVSGWYGGNARDGTAWALAFGAGGPHETIDVRFADVHHRRAVPVVSDHYGLWVAEVSGAFRVATILGATTTATLRLKSS